MRHAPEISGNGTSTFPSSRGLLRGGCVEGQVINFPFPEVHAGGQIRDFSASLCELTGLGRGRLLEICDLWTHMTWIVRLFEALCNGVIPEQLSVFSLPHL